MDTLSQEIFKDHLSFMVKTDPTFRDDFIDVLLNLEPDDSVIDQITTHFAEQIESGKFSKFLVRQELQKILGDKKMTAFSRVMQITTKFGGEARIDKNSWARHFQDLAFSPATGINLIRISETKIDLQRLKVFDSLNNEEKTLLEQLTMKEKSLLSNFTPEGMKIFLTDEIEDRNTRLKQFNHLSEADRKTFWLLDQQQYNILTSFSKDEKKILKGLDPQIIKVASTLTETELDQLLSLPNEAYDEILNEDFLTRVRDIIHLLPEGNPSSPIIGYLEPEEEIILKRLTQIQKSILSEIYNLPSRAIKTLFHLNVERIIQIMRISIEGTDSNMELNREETVLLRRIKDLPYQSKYQLMDFGINEWEIFQDFEGNIRDVLINLSPLGIDVLRSMTHMTEEQVSFVEKMSNKGLAVLAGNSQLNPVIQLIMELDDTVKQRYILNLDLNDRLSLREKFIKQAPVEGNLLATMARLNEREELWLHISERFSASEARLYKYLDNQRATVLTGLCDLDDQSIFNIWKLIFDPDVQLDEKLSTEVSKLYRSYPGMGSKLLANVIAASRFQGTKGLKILESLNQLDPVFFMDLLRLSVSDEYSSNIIQIIHQKEFNVETLARVYDYSNEFEFFHWILINSLEKGNEILYDLARAVFFDRLRERNRLDWEKIFNSRTEGMILALSEQLTVENYRLAQSLFLSLNSNLFSHVFNRQQSFDFLNSEIYKGGPEIPYLLEQPNVFSLFNTNRLKFLRVSAYFHRGDAVPFLKRLDDKTIVEFINTDLGEELLRSSLSDGRLDLLRFLRQRLDPVEVRNLIRKKDYSIVKNFIEAVKSAKYIQDFHSVLHILNEIDPNIPHDQSYYTDIESLETDTIGHQDFNRHCSFRKRKDNVYLPCIDSREPTEEQWRTEHVAGFTFTMFLVGQHLANGDVETMGYDALNLYIMPKMGGMIAEAISKSDSQFLKTCAPILGRGIGNLFAFVGLAEGLKARRRAENIIDKKIANLYIASNSIFIAADIPAMAGEFVTEMGTVATMLGPIGDAVSITVLVGTYFWDAKLKLEKLQEHIRLTNWEKFASYWSIVWSGEEIDKIKDDLEAEKIFQEYISDILDKFKDDYDRIGLSVPRWVTEKEESYESHVSHWVKYATIGMSTLIPCTSKTKILWHKFYFEGEAVVRNNPTFKTSRLLPACLEDYKLVCSPSANDIVVDVLCRESSKNFNKFCDIFSPERLWRKSIKRHYLPDDSNVDCQEMILYEKNQTLNSMFYVSHDSFVLEWSPNESINVVFLGKNLSIKDSSNTISTGEPINNYVLVNDLSSCKVHKRGVNYFHTKESRLICDLGNQQDNVAVIQGSNFIDSQNIRSVIGNEKKNKITISYASYVDGRGGYDHIIAKHSTTVKAYFGDRIVGQATVVLPMRIGEIARITVESSVFILSNKSGWSVKMIVNDQEFSKFITSDGYFVVPIQKFESSNKVRRIRVHKVSNVHIIFQKELVKLRNVKNPNFKMIKHLSSPGYEIILSEVEHNVFIADENLHNYFWEGPIDNENLYILNRIKGNVTISQTNGILDFGLLEIGMKQMKMSLNNGQEIVFENEDLRVLLLTNYKNVTVTFDRKEYYKLEGNLLKRDFCSHVLQVEGRISIDSFDLIDHHNCFDFHSNKVQFVNSNATLILVSGNNVLSMNNYYTPVRDSLDLSLKLNSYIMTPDEFRKRADNPSTIKYYKIDEQGLQIYHNQPENKNEIGFVDLTKWSIKEFRMKISNDHLFISYWNETLFQVRIENWRNYPPAREMMFSFKDETFANKECIVSNCYAEDVLKEFERVQGSKSKRAINNQESKIQYCIESCIAENFSLLLVVLQNFLNKNYPLPTKRSVTPEKVFANACHITQDFENTLREIAHEFRITLEDVDFFDVYTNVASLLREEKYSCILETFYSVAESVALGNKTFLDTCKRNFKIILRKHYSIL